MDVPSTKTSSNHQTTETNMPSYEITAEQKLFFEEHGYLIVQDMMSASETTALQQWAQQVHDLPRTAETPWMPYEEINAAGKRVLCRTENYANYHADFNALLRGERMLSLLGQLAGEDMLLFKEKSECDDNQTVYQSNL